MKDDIEKIIYYGTLAPSGDNSQPWRFEVKGDEISIFDLPEKDRSIYNFNGIAAYISHGALIENIVIASKNLGYQTQVSLLPILNSKNLVAQIKLSRLEKPEEENLFTYIEKRQTNRKNFETRNLTEEEKDVLKSSVQETGFGEIRLNRNREELEELANLLALNERLVFEVKQMHHFFFKHLNWTKKEDTEKNEGMYIKTLELNRVQEIMFRVFKYWPILNLFNKIGLSKMIEKENAKIHAASGSIGIILVQRTGKMEDFIKIGQLLERVWLKATKLNLGFQLITGLSFLEERFNNHNFDYLNTQQKNSVIKTNGKIYQIFGIDNNNFFLPFRIGYSEPPQAGCSRNKPEIKFIESD